jgi:hypothetical protein
MSASICGVTKLTHSTLSFVIDVIRTTSEPLILLDAGGTAWRKTIMFNIKKMTIQRECAEQNVTLIMMSIFNGQLSFVRNATHQSLDVLHVWRMTTFQLAAMIVWKECTLLGTPHNAPDVESISSKKLMVLANIAQTMLRFVVDVLLQKEMMLGFVMTVLETLTGNSLNKEVKSALANTLSMLDSGMRETETLPTVRNAMKRLKTVTDVSMRFCQKTSQIQLGTQLLCAQNVESLSSSVSLEAAQKSHADSGTTKGCASSAMFNLVKPILLKKIPVFQSVLTHTRILKGDVTLFVMMDFI